MKKSLERYDEVCELIASGKSDQACSIFMLSWRSRLLSYLRRYRWSQEEAMELIHDAYLLIEKKINTGDLKTFNITYVKKICKNLGANSWRKNIRKKNEFLAYASIVKKELNETFKNNFNIELFEEDEMASDHRLTLRAFDLLNDKCRAIIRMKHVDHLNHDDIVNKTDSISNVNSSKSILNRCMKAWKTFIEKIKSEANPNE
ncbi:MAG: sigma-70 family RNA polymerase sigma factor [Bacteroidetes bacterium]|jgi:DNA-directed RNA polymerase specialized sigma24 family protein|nr:sigma-70 family RNA polymerase sigma factor [Bacteroidota bacterium]MBT7827631.1 sigma-70 family RNA polymerase sigma factor [Bacteroidota bacterium]